MLKRSLICAIGLPCTLLLSACPERSAVWVETGSTAGHLVIGIGTTPHGPPPANLYGLTVVRCGEENRLPASAVWTIARAKESPVPGRVLYGSTPPGFETRVPAQAITPGCYRIQDSGSGRTIFDVATNGAVSTR